MQRRKLILPILTIALILGIYQVVDAPKHDVYRVLLSHEMNLSNNNSVWFKDQVIKLKSGIFGRTYSTADSTLAHNSSKKLTELKLYIPDTVAAQDIFNSLEKSFQYSPTSIIDSEFKYKLIDWNPLLHLMVTGLFLILLIDFLFFLAKPKYKEKENR